MNNMYVKSLGKIPNVAKSYVDWMYASNDDIRELFGIQAHPVNFIVKQNKEDKQ